MIIPNLDYTARERSVCERLAPLTNVRRLLNIGMRHPGDSRNLWWISICKANGSETHVLEVFEPNCRELRAAGIENVTCGDVRNVSTIYDQPFDGILWWHGPEQIEKSEAPGVFDALWRLTEGIIIVGCPLGDERQGICYGNPHEKQRSVWQPEDLAALGFQSTVVRDAQPYPHITAWRNRGGQEEGRKGRGEEGTERARGGGDGETRGQRDEERTEVTAATGGRSQESEVRSQKGTAPSAIADGISHAKAPRGEDAGILTNSATGMSDSDSSFILPPSSFRLALIFDDKTRPETTGVYCRNALKSLVDVEFFHPDDLAKTPRTGFDLYLAIDDGLDYPWPGELHPCAYWAIDTHMDFERCLRRARQVDFVFAAQKDGAEQLRQAGIRSAQWLPLACDPAIHGRQDVPEQYDVCFVGNLFPGPRTDLVRLLQQYYHNAFVGNAYFEDMARVYSASKIVFNRSLRSDVNMRVFEALASGSLLVTNDLTQNGQRELFHDGVHLVTYSDGDELLDKLRYYLGRDDLRKRIAVAGRAEALAKHTYRHRMEKVLEAVIGHSSLVIGQAAETSQESAERGAPECGAEWKRKPRHRRVFPFMPQP